MPRSAPVPPGSTHGGTPDVNHHLTHDTPSGLDLDLDGGAGAAAVHVWVR